MPKSLVIVESPAKSKTISKFLGKDYTVAASMGHIMDLPRSKMGVDPKKNFAPEYIVIPERKKHISEIKKAAKDKDHIYLAADPDREGEAISWHLSNLLGNGKKIQRVSFHEITKEAVQEAFKHPRGLDMNLVNAQQARRVLDRIVGYSLSPLLWKKVGRGLSAGRVQSVAVKLIVEREREIQAFVPQEYWDIEAELKKQLSAISRQLSAKDGNSFIAKLDKIEDKKAEVKTGKEAQNLVEEIKKQQFVVSQVKESKKKRNPGPPFTTSKLQQEAFNKLHFSVSKTMKVAQDLYEGVELGKSETIGLITYMRTDSVNISKEAQRVARDYILKKFGSKYYPEIPNVYKSKKTAQEAHEAIRPTTPLHDPELIKKYLTPDQFKLYKLIWDRFISSQMSAAVFNVTTVDITAGRFLFKVTGTTVLFDGFTVMYQVDENDKEEKNLLPKLSAGEKLDLIKLDPSQHFTKPPPRYSDASLVKALEEKGIGRPSTYAPTIYTIVARNYVHREKGYLSPTELGIVVTDLLLQYFQKIMDEKFTARMEEELDMIEEGKMDWVKVLRVFYRPFSFELKMAHSYMKAVKKEVTPTDQVCEKCGKPMVIKWGRRGKFLSCSGFPECKFAKTIGTGVKCPEAGCGGELVQRRSKRGFFYGCSNYPKCTHISKRLPEEEINNPPSPQRGEEI